MKAIGFAGGVMSSIGHHDGDPVWLPEHGHGMSPHLPRTKQVEHVMHAKPLLGPSEPGLGTLGQSLSGPLSGRIKGVPLRGQPPRKDDQFEED